MKLINKIQKLVTVYTFDDGFYVEVSNRDGFADFYLGHNNYSIKTHLFGCSADPAEYDTLLLANIDEAIATYREDYFDEEE